MDIDRRELQRWLLDAIQRTNDTPTALARRAGLAQSTLTRFLNSEDSPNLSLRSVAKIAHAAGVDPPNVAASVSAAIARPRSGFSAPDAARYEPNSENRPLQRAIAAFIGNEPATDAWTLKTLALETAGYIPGDILIVNLNAEAKAGDIVCAQAYRWNEGRADTVFRVFEPPYFVAASKDAAMRKPLVVDNDRVIIKGVVTGMLRQP